LVAWGNFFKSKIMYVIPSVAKIMLWVSQKNFYISLENQYFLIFTKNKTPMDQRQFCSYFNE